MITKALLDLPFIANSKPGTLVAIPTFGALGGNFGGGTSQKFGFQFVTNASITIVSIGRWKRTGNTSTVTLRILNSAASSSLASVTLDLSTAVTEAFNYVLLSSPLVLSAGTYNCMFDYLNAGAADDFYQGGGNGVASTSLTSPIISIASSYIDSGSTYHTAAAGSDFGPVNFKFHL